MKNPEYKDAVTPYSKADRVIIRASLNQSRLDNKKGSAKKTVKPVSKKTSPKMPGKGPAVKVTDSRFKGMGAGKPKSSATKPKDSRFTGLGAGKPKSSGSMSYTAGSAKNNKATYTTGSGVSSKASTPKAAPAQKTKPRFGGFSMLASGLTKKQDTSTAAFKADQARMKAKFDAARAAKGKK
jgi:hypothetical protein